MAAPFRGAEATALMRAALSVDGLDVWLVPFAEAFIHLASLYPALGWLFEPMGREVAELAHWLLEMTEAPQFLRCSTMLDYEIGVGQLEDADFHTGPTLVADLYRMLRMIVHVLRVAAVSPDHTPMAPVAIAYFDANDAARLGLIRRELMRLALRTLPRRGELLARMNVGEDEQEARRLVDDATASSDAVLACLRQLYAARQIERLLD